jgi:RNA recognition motif-containing protein
MIIYVSNLGEKVTPDSLEVLFATYGKVSSPILIRDEAAVGPRRFALVEMMSSTEAVHAISKLHGSIIDGCG